MERLQALGQQLQRRRSRPGSCPALLSLHQDADGKPRDQRYDAAPTPDFRHADPVGESPASS